MLIAIGDYSLNNLLIIFSLYFVIDSSTLQAQVIESLSPSLQTENTVNERSTTRKELSDLTKESIQNELKDLGLLSEVDAEAKIEALNSKLLQYFQLRDKECKGEFSSMEINEKGESEIVKRRLSKDERKMCMMDLISFRKNYINEIFVVRKKIMLKNHQDQLKELDEIRKLSIKRMDDMASKLK
jgi:hypothetical protein